MKVHDGADITRDHPIDCDVAVVGSGPAGSAVARHLAGQGADVVVLEAGAHVRPSHYPADAFSAMAALYRGLGATITRGNPPMPYVQGRAVGGTSVINGAISWRLPRDVWQRWCEDDPALADALAWERLEAVMDQVEQDLSIAPTDPAISGPNNDLMARGADALGLEHRRIRRNVSGCQGLGRCLEGCSAGRKLSMDRSYLAEASERGARVFSSVTVDRIVCHQGRAVGVEGLASGGGRVRVSAAKAVVLAASAVHTPVLLMRNGITHGPVGRHFQCHPGASVMGRFAEPVRMWTGATQGHEVIGLRKEGIKFEALGLDVALAASRLKSVGSALTEELGDLDHRACWGAAIKAEAHGRVRPSGTGERVDFSLTPADMDKVRRGVGVLGQMMLAAGADYVSPGVYGWADKVDDPDEMARFQTDGPLDPKAYTMVATHMFGTCRMGSDPKTSVVGPDFRHHRVDGLYVADSSVFPTNTGVNPQTSILTMATVCAHNVAGR